MVDNLNGIGGLLGQTSYDATGVPPYARGEIPRREIPHYKETRDRVTLSAQARKKTKADSAGIKDEKELNSEEKQQVNELKKRDAEVKAHEQAHMAAGGGVVQGGASYQYEHGPDGKMYAVGGEVKIDVSPEKTPEGTIRKMQQVQRAALAPAQPSGTDRAVAAQAAQIEVQARMEKAQNDPEPSEFPTASTEWKGNEAFGPVDPGMDPSGSDPIFSYKADLSPSAHRSGKATGSRIDLSV